MQWKLFWSLFGPSATISIPLIPKMLGVPWWAVSLVVLIISIITIIAMGEIVNNADAFRTLHPSRQSEIATLCRLAVASYSACVVLFLTVPVHWSWCVFTTSALGLVTYWLAKGEEYRVIRVAAKQVAETSKTDNDNKTQQGPTEGFRKVISKAGYPRVRVLAHNPIVDDDGNTYANQFLIQVPPTGK